MTESRYANWKAPAEDGRMLIWPAPDDLLRETHENARALAGADSIRIGGVPLPALRRGIRRWLGHQDGDGPLVATGHQTELYHPGVWVKDILTNAVADRVGGKAIHFAVDTDHPKHLAVQWPGESLPITDDPALNTAAWSGLLAAPTPLHLRSTEQSLQTAIADWNFQPVLGDVLGSLRGSAMQQYALSAAITNAQHQLDWSLGLRHHAMLASPIFASREYLIFVQHVLSRAGQFAVDYNRALADYRVEAGISSNTRPMPDLRITEDEVEAPFWLDDLANRSRTRAAVHPTAHGWALGTTVDRFILETAADGERAGDSLAAWLAHHRLRLAPRALTLTTFFRLLVVDQFIHGIGGGRYDQITDRLLASHFGIEPPRFAVTTATMLFPGAVGQSRVCMPCLRQEEHRLKHGLLGKSKRHILTAINAMPRGSVQRSLAFHNMHGALSAAAVDNPIIAEWSSRYERSQLREKQEKILFNRELFYAMQSRARLEAMIAGFNSQLKMA